MFFAIKEDEKSEERGLNAAKAVFWVGLFKVI
jgi:hypothetical protein